MQRFDELDTSGWVEDETVVAAFLDLSTSSFHDYNDLGTCLYDASNLEIDFLTFEVSRSNTCWRMRAMEHHQQVYTETEEVDNVHYTTFSNTSSHYGEVLL